MALVPRTVRDKLLRNFSVACEPTESVIQAARVTSHQILQLLARHIRYVDRLYITSICAPCVEMTAFVQGHYDPPFPIAVDDIRQVLRSQGPFVLYNFHLHTCDWPLVFDVNNIHVRMVVAPAFTVQTDMTLSWIQNLPAPLVKGPFFSSALGECVSKFIQGQSDFVLTIVRLAKWWDGKISTSNYLPWRNLLIDLVAVSTAQRQETANSALADKSPETSPSLYNGFLSFLELMRDFEWINVEWSLPWYNVSQVPHELRTQRPLVMHPVNPFHNVANGVPRELLISWRLKAMHSIQRLALLGKYSDIHELI